MFSTSNSLSFVLNCSSFGAMHVAVGSVLLNPNHPVIPYPLSSWPLLQDPRHHLLHQHPAVDLPYETLILPFQSTRHPLATFSLCRNLIPNGPHPSLAIPHTVAVRIPPWAGLCTKEHHLLNVVLVSCALNRFIFLLPVIAVCFCFCLTV